LPATRSVKQVGGGTKKAPRKRGKREGKSKEKSEGAHDGGREKTKSLDVVPNAEVKLGKYTPAEWRELTVKARERVQTLRGKR
jgi:hypothetical protein